MRAKKAGTLLAMPRIVASPINRLTISGGPSASSAATGSADTADPISVATAAGTAINEATSMCGRSFAEAAPGIAKERTYKRYTKKMRCAW